MKKFFNKDKTVNQIKNWYQDRYETVLIQRNVFFILFIVMIGIFAFSILGVIKLNSQKVYEPFIVQVEENTGVITKVNSKTIRNLPAEKAMRDSSLVRYVISREGYNYADYRFNYFEVVRLMSSKNVFRDFRAWISPDSPRSPLPLSDDFILEPTIKSIVDLDEKQNLVQVRINVAKKSNRNPDKVISEDSYIITLRYDYKNLDLSETQRYINPLGLQIIAYRRDKEQDAKRF